VICDEGRCHGLPPDTSMKITATVAKIRTMSMSDICVYLAVHMAQILIWHLENGAAVPQLVFGYVLA
jgi:hypothetical protein